MEYAAEPLGLDTAAPRFGWRMAAKENARGLAQTAYRLEVKGPAGQTVWESGKRAAAVREGVTFLRHEKGKIVYRLASGRYTFESPWK